MLSPIDDSSMQREDLIAHLEQHSEVLGNPRIKAAFEAIDRADFMPLDYRSEAYEDYAVPIGFNQTISQPTTVAFMLEQLDPEPGHKILDVGSGSGFTTALLAHMVRNGGRVVGLERVPELVAFGSKNLAKYDFPHASIEAAEETVGKASMAPFDRILVSAAAHELPRELVRELRDGGIMVIPIGDSICKIVKNGPEGISQTCFPGFAFVPLY
jgi:protein-L-isoaspartate(D-aspartate) O-methyltransferase